MANFQTYLFGKKFPNRIFVGGLPVNTDARELGQFFCFFGQVTESKIILDDNGVSKGYGFVTFLNEQSVGQVESMGILYFKNKKLNIGPAVKKQCSVIQPEPVLLSQSLPAASLAMVPLQQSNANCNYNLPGFAFNGGYQQDPQPHFQFFMPTDYCGYFHVTSDGVHWQTYPGYSTAPDQSATFHVQSQDCSSNGSGDIASSDRKFKHVFRKWHVAPRFRKK